MTTAPDIVPDDKDWTWVLDRPCPECGFDVTAVEPGTIGAVLRDDAARWRVVLADPRAATRPAPAVWSPVEYACHVRDVNRVFAGRLARMLDEHDPLFANWDQDATAIEERYDRQVAAEVAPQVVEAAALVAAVYDRVPADAWTRPGRRSNGSSFTVDTLGRYHLHDLLHHRWDVRWIMAG